MNNATGVKGGEGLNEHFRDRRTMLAVKGILKS